MPLDKPNPDWIGAYFMPADHELMLTDEEEQQVPYVPPVESLWEQIWVTVAFIGIIALCMLGAWKAFELFLLVV